jgi:hypothetical protein
MGRKKSPVGPDETLTEVLPRWLVATLAVVTFVLAGVLFGFGLFSPERFDSPTARFVLCLAIALNLSVFFFVLYPKKVELTKIPGINLTVKLVGPIVLYIVVLLLLLKLMPEAPPPVAYRLFFPHEDGRRTERIRWQLVTLEPADEPFTFYLVPDGQDSSGLAAVCVKFESGRTRYKARFKATFYQPADVVFERGPAEGTFEVAPVPAP